MLEPGLQCGAASLLASSQRHETHSIEPFLRQPGRGSFDETQRLVVAPDGHDHSATRRKLLQKGIGNARRGRGDDDAVDRVDVLRESSEQGGLVAAPGSDLENVRERLRPPHRLEHARHHEWLRDGLLETDRQRGVFVGAAREPLVDEDVPRHRSHRRQHRLVAYSVLSQTRDHTVARPLRRHPDAMRPEEIHFVSQLRTTGICAGWVRSICSGVSDTRSEATAWKSVPGPASCAPPAAPTQYTVWLRGVVVLMAGSALWRLPSRVTS